jgi:microcystin degradation protein MlrC
MHAFVERMREVERHAGVLAVSAFHGFWLSDTPWSNGCVLVTTDGDEALARRLGEELAVEMIAAARQVQPGLGVDAALDAALAATERPVVLSDRGDNAGGGAAGDSTFLLRALLERGVEDAALGMIWDPVAAEFAHRAGVGSRVSLRLGGKTSRFSGDPLDVEATVLAVRDDARQAWFGEGPPRSPLGRSAALRIGGVDVVVNSERQQVFDTRCFTEHGIDPAAKRLVVVKSTAHFRRAFAPIAGRIVDCDSPGNVTVDPAALAYCSIPRPVYPLDRDFDMRPTPLLSHVGRAP